MRTTVMALAVLWASLPAASQDPDHIYTNKTLGVRFPGVFGWEVEKFGETGAWTTLARYEEPAFQAVVELQATPNTYPSMDEFRKLIRAEFPEPKYTITDEKDVQLKNDAKLNGIRIEAKRRVVDEKGKKRDYRLLVCTYYGKNRVFRVRCEAPQIRWKRVKDRFESAINGLRITSGKEVVQGGTPFYSQRGAYRCVVPDGYTVVLPSKKSSSDARFQNRRRDGLIVVYAYRFRGDLQDHIDQLVDYYGDEFIIDSEDAHVLGGKGFTGLLEIKNEKWRILGTGNRKGRVYRVHQKLKAGAQEDEKRILDKFLKSLKTG
ncbi:MAG: hypothetical protein O7C98_08900 [Planctomycetota bacterium]|nr:hypothetical protein [Planctomycetota bacterium]